MSFSGRALRCFVILSLLGVLGATNAHTYLDPGTGSYILQLVLAALLGAAFAVKVFWVRIRTFVANLISRKPRQK
jgi:hypothetical protein